MRRFGIVVLLFALWSPAAAQERTGYVGLGISYGIYRESYPSYPMPSLHIGGSILNGFELRGTLESLLATSNLGAEVLYTIALDALGTRLYAGGGVSLRWLGVSPVGVDLRGIFGGEYPLANMVIPANLFAEMRFYVNGGATEFPTFEGRAGINFPF